MEKGLAWIGSDERDSGKVIVLLHDGETTLLPAARYVAKGVKPPIYELPRQLENAGQ